MLIRELTRQFPFSCTQHVSRPGRMPPIQVSGKRAKTLRNDIALGLSNTGHSQQAGEQLHLVSCLCTYFQYTYHCPWETEKTAGASI